MPFIFQLPATRGRIPGVIDEAPLQMAAVAGRFPTKIRTQSNRQYRGRALLRFVATERASGLGRQTGTIHAFCA
jgi:hypothetical protein